MHVLLAFATRNEIAPTLAWLAANCPVAQETFFQKGNVTIVLCRTGVGIMESTAHLAEALHEFDFDFALQTGVAGAFNRGIALGEVVRVESEVLADFGAEDRDGTFLDVYHLGLAGKDDAPFQAGRLSSPDLEALPGAAFDNLHRASGLTVQTVSGAEETIAKRTARYGADVETMEGAPFHYCCLRAGVPFVQIRAISNYVEPRNRGAWKMKEAIEALNSHLIRAMEFWVGETPTATP